MSRAMWQGRLCVENINLPVSVYTTTDKTTTGLNNICNCHQKPIRQKYVCSETGEEVSRENMGKGFAVGDQVIPLDLKQLEAIGASRSDRIKLRFAKEEQVLDLRLTTDKTYYIAVSQETDKKTKKLKVTEESQTAIEDYTVLYNGLKANKAVGICELTLKAEGRTRVAIVKPQNGWLVLQMLHYSEQLKDFELKPYDLKLEQADLEAGKKFVSDRIENVNLSEYTDNYSRQLQDIIENKPIQVVVEKELPKPQGKARDRWSMPSTPKEVLSVSA